MPTCLECSKYFKLLNSHICRTHKMTTTEYKEKHGYDTPFMDNSVKELKLKNGFSVWSVSNVMERYNMSESDAITFIKNKSSDTFSSETSVWSKKYWLKNGFSETEANEKVRERQSRGLDFYIKHNGIEQGTELYNKKISDLAKFNSTEGMISRGYTEDQIREYKDNFSVETLMKKYNIDEIAANELRITRRENMFSCWTKKFWVEIKGYSEKDAIEKVSKLQTRDLEFFTRKYGEIDGTIRYNKWVRAATKHSIGKYSSKESLEFFKPFTDYCKSNNIEYKEEKYFSVGTKSYYVDLCVDSAKLIFEYDGQAFHADPENYDLNWKSAKKGMDYEISLKYDNKKQSDLESIGYKVIRIYSKRKHNFNLIEIFESINNGK